MNQSKVKFLNLPLQQRKLKKQLLSALSEVMDSSQFILGPQTRALEEEIAKVCGAKHGIGVNSGTDALVLALRALNIGPGDEVIVPDFTFIATATAVLLAGATPVLADVEPDTLTLDPKQVERLITRKTKALLPVHLYGQPADMTALLALARRHKLAVVEDACQSLGATWRGRPVGAMGAVGCLSFFPTKNLGALGDAGMLVTNQAALAKRLLRLRNHGCEQKYFHLELGYNSRLDEMQAAALRVKLPHLPAWDARRQVLAQRYAAGLAGTAVTLPCVRPQAGHVYHQYVIRVSQRDTLRDFLSSQGIESAVHYPLPLHRQPALSRLTSSRKRFPVSGQAAQEILCLPITPELTDAEQRRVIGAIRVFYKL